MNKREKMSTLFIIGNGFDLAHGIPTQYRNFRNFVDEMYPNAKIYQGDTIYLEDFIDIDADELSAEILLNTMDKVCGSDWNNFEESLAHLNFTDKFPKLVHETDETDEEDNAKSLQYLLYMDRLTNGFAKCAELWQEFFRLWIKNVEQGIESGEYHAKRELQQLFFEPNIKFLNFNYTKTLQVLYGIKSVTHIHNRVGQKLIFGHGEDDVIYDANDDKELLFYATSLNDIGMSFRKNTMTQLKKYEKFFKKLNTDIDKVYSYGFSYSKVDSIYIKLIINSIAPDAIWFFTKFDAQDREGLRRKKVKLRNYGFKGSFDIYDV